jgi:hypothetical protein
MDFVYICRSGENEELRYSIRSVVSSFTEARIWVVGGKPDWYLGNYIEVAQDRHKYANAFNNIIAICDSKEISESFVLMNDDFFILKRFDLNDIFHGGPLVNKIKTHIKNMPDSRYGRKLIETRDMLKSNNLYDSLDYELHVPMVLEKDKLRVIVKKYPELLWRSMYGNLYRLGGKEIKDVKVYSDPRRSDKSMVVDKDSVFVSTQDDSFNIIYESFLKEMFLNPTTLEK